jgi:hypothetical protein
MFAGKHAGKFHLADRLFQGWQHLSNFGKSLFVPTLLAKLDQDLNILQAIGCRLPIFNKLLQCGPFFQNLLGLLIIIPEFWPGNFRFQLRDALTLAINVKGTSSAQRACPGGFPTIQFLHETL